ncbi:MAG TPA: glycoside hydrolase family 15 protein [bacterium]|nr:glycoside hydrolase family 15 protein [bacterium]
MPRDLPLGNGVLQVNFDLQHHLIDIYYPDVGGENHALGHPFRLGVWTGGRFAWTGDDGWRRTLRYMPETLVTDVTLEHPDLGVRLALQECVDFHVNAFVRRIAVANLAPETREIRVFCHHDFRISGTEVGETAYYDPNSRGLFHYKARRWFHANILTPGGVGWTQFATGVKEWEAREGTWRDAEDGVLGMNAIAQGSVDSTGGVALTVPAGGEQAVYYWLLAGETYEELRGLNRYVQARGPEALLRRTRDYWYLWVNKETMDFGPLPPDVVTLFKQSLLIARTQIDNKGAIIASTDSDILRFGRDTYTYVWPRDGALAAHALDMAGYNDLTRSFYQFCGDVITREGFLLHKYNPDKSVGSSWHPWVADGARQFPIQEDETALVVWALWLHFAANRDVEFIKPLYRPLVTKAAEFLTGFRDTQTGLPLPSYDLWEERHGVHAFTCGAVHGGLLCAAALADAFGETERAARYRAAADEIRAGVLRDMWSAEAGRFGRMLAPGAAGESRLDLTIDASLYGLFAFGMLAPDDPMVIRTMQAVEERLWVRTPVGGIARYEDDHYHQVSADTGPVPGNPWIVCTMWLAQWYIARARSADDLARPLDLLRWAAAKALPSGVLPEQVHPMTGELLSVSPLTWSHVEFVETTVRYLDRLHALDVCASCGVPRYRRQESHLIRPHTAALGVPADAPAPAKPA